MRIRTSGRVGRNGLSLAVQDATTRVRVGLEGKLLYHSTDDDAHGLDLRAELALELGELPVLEPRVDSLHHTTFSSLLLVGSDVLTIAHQVGNLFSGQGTNKAFRVVAKISQQQFAVVILHPIQQACKMKHALVIVVALADGHTEHIAKLVADDLVGEKVHGLVRTIVAILARVNSISLVWGTVDTSSSTKMTNVDEPISRGPLELQGRAKMDDAPFKRTVHNTAGDGMLTSQFGGFFDMSQVLEGECN